MKYARYFLYIIIFICLLVWRWQVVSEREFVFEKKLSEKVNFTGIVIGEPDRRETTTRLVVEPEGKTERVLLITDPYPEYKYGDKVTVSGKLTKPENFETETGREFDYVNYLAKERIYYQIFRPSIIHVSSGNGWWYREKLFALKQWFLNNLGNNIPEPEASLAGGLVVGAKQGLGEELNNDFRTVGLSHIVVLSGQNLSIIADVVFKYLSFLPLRTAISTSSILIILFALMAGGGASLLRATLMALVVLLARATGRIYDSARALLVAVALMLLWNPRLAVYDLGFQLSVLATTGVIYGVPIFNRLLTHVPERFALRETISTTLAAQVAVLPWIAYKIGSVSIIAPVVNVLVVPLIPVTMFLVFLVGAFGFTIISLPIVWLAHIALKYVLTITAIFADLPLASVTIKTLPVIAVVFLYAGLSWWVIRYYQYR